MYAMRTIQVVPSFQITVGMLVLSSESVVQYLQPTNMHTMHGRLDHPWILHRPKLH